MPKSKDDNWKPVTAQPVLSKKQQPSKPFEDQRECSQCKGENFKILEGASPKGGTLGYFLMCSHCGYGKWIQGKRNP